MQVGTFAGLGALLLSGCNSDGPSQVSTVPGIPAGWNPAKAGFVAQTCVNGWYLEPPSTTCTFWCTHGQSAIPECAQPDCEFFTVAGFLAGKLVGGGLFHSRKAATCSTFSPLTNEEYAIGDDNVITMSPPNLRWPVVQCDDTGFVIQGGIPKVRLAPGLGKVLDDAWARGVSLRGAHVDE